MSLFQPRDRDSEPTANYGGYGDGYGGYPPAGGGGFPPGGSGGFPPSGGGGFPPGASFPPGAGFSPGGGDGRPDWQAMAEANETQQNRKRRLAVIGGVLGVALVGGVVAAVATVGGSSSANASGSNGSANSGASGSASVSAAASTGASMSARPSAPASAKPTVKAQPPAWPPLNAGAVLYAQKLSVGKQVYVRKLTDEKSPCWEASTGHLGNALAPNRCSQMLRATWVSGNQAVSVGVAVFPDAAAAQAANAAYVGHIEPLRGAGIPNFCQDKTPCALAHGVVGHFTYYVIAGPSGSAPGMHNPASVAATQRMASFAVTALKRQR
ncbi:hypothetical protein [Streptacidiphilus sp. MAP5-3]|uniref:hypothetical protein n=1 Tax=unclassified Streptacidiphilus TaxID=2643834 RepID=UPI003519C6FF